MNDGALRLVAVTDALRGGIDELARRAAAVVTGGATLLTKRHACWRMRRAPFAPLRRACRSS